MRLDEFVCPRERNKETPDSLRAVAVKYTQAVVSFYSTQIFFCFLIGLYFFVMFVY